MKPIILCYLFIQQTYYANVLHLGAPLFPVFQYHSPRNTFITPLTDSSGMPFFLFQHLIFSNTFPAFHSNNHSTFLRSLRSQQFFLFCFFFVYLAGSDVMPSSGPPLLPYYRFWINKLLPLPSALFQIFLEVCINFLCICFLAYASDVSSNHAYLLHEAYLSATVKNVLSGRQSHHQIYFPKM